MDKRTMQARVRETIYPNGQGAIKAQEHQDLLLEMVDEIYKKTEEAVEPDGTYPNMSVGLADDLAGHGESIPAEFTFRASGGKSIKDGRAYIKAIKGNSVVWNQLADSWDKTEIKAANFSYYDDYAETNLWQGYDPIRINMNMSARNGHKILMLLAYQNESGSPWMNLEIAGTVMGGFGSSQDICKFYVVNVGENDTNYLTLYPSGDQGYVKLSHLRVYDLTLMFGTGNEPTTIEEFNARKPIVEDENAYNEGQVIHMTAEGIKSIGDNAWDEQWEEGHINYNTGVDSPDSGRLRTKGYIRVLPNEEYHLSLPTASYPSDLVVVCYDENKAFVQHIGGGSANKTFRIPTNCHYIRFTWDGTQYGNNIMLSLVHSGWKVDTDAVYQPYWQDTLPLPIISNYFPNGMKSAGSAHDEIRFNKATNKWEAVQRIGSVDLGVRASEITPSLCINGEYRWLLWKEPTIKTIEANDVPANMISVFDIGTADSTYLNKNGIAIDTENNLWLYDSRYVNQSDKDSVVELLQGVILYYELAEPIVTEITEDFRDYYKVADFGTEELLTSMPSAPFSADIIYQFNAVDMIREHELEITELQKVIATMQAQLASLTNN